MPVIEAIVAPLKKGQATNSTASAFAVADSRPTITKPVGSTTRTVVEWENAAQKGRNTLKLVPYGGNDNNDVANVKVIGWNSVLSNVLGVTSVLYIPRIICELQYTLSSALPGIAGMAVVATELFADTITLTSGIAVVHQGTADVDIAWAEMDVSGYEYIEVLGDLGAGGDTMNWLLGWC